MRVVGAAFGAAFLAALVSGLTQVAAQSPYGDGGFLERPDVPDDEAGAATPEPSRQRRPRADAPTQAQHPSDIPQVTGATSGSAPLPQRRPAAAQAKVPSQSPATLSTQQQITPHPASRPVVPAAAQERAPRQADRTTADRTIAADGSPPLPPRRPPELPRKAAAALTAPAPVVPTAAPPVEAAPAAAASEPAAPTTPAEPAAPAAEADTAALPLDEAAPPSPPADRPAELPAAAETPAPTPGETADQAAPPPAAQDSPASAPEQEAAPTSPAVAETAPPEAPDAAPAAEAQSPAPEPAQTASAASEPRQATEAESEPAAQAKPNPLAETKPEAAAEPKAAPPTLHAATEAGAPSEPAPALADVPAESPASPAAPAETAAQDEPAPIAEATPSEPAPPSDPAPAETAPETVAPLAAAPAPMTTEMPPLPSPRPAAVAAAAGIVATDASTGGQGVSAEALSHPAAAIREARALPAATDNAPAMPRPLAAAAAPALIDKMIGQMLMVGFRGLTPEEAWPQKLAAQLKAGTVGGVLVMSHNIQSPQQLKSLMSFLQRAKGDIPALFATDQEGGIVQRLSAEKGFQTYPTAGKIGKTNDPLTAYSVYGRLAAELSQFGFNMNLGPVVDLDRNAQSPIIAGKERSFGPQPKHVTAFAKAFALAHQDAGVLTVLKHFPGHGSTPFDTHTQPVDTGAAWDQAELEPYNELIEANVAQAVMVGHISNRLLSEEPGLPASLSSRTIRDILRGALGFHGVVISDDLEMGAVRARYKLEEAAVKALKAGNDIVILSNQATPTPELPQRIIAAVKKALDDGTLKREELQASYDRILAMKQRLGGTVATAAKAAGVTKRASADRPRPPAR